LTEAALHLLEAVDCWDKESDFIADCISIDSDGKPLMKIPNRRCPEDDLASRMATLHSVGCFRALVGALDCLGASIIGVLALPENIQRADLKVARKALQGSRQHLHTHFLGKLDQTIKDAGPEGWLEWVTDYRNMVVHRGRRMHITQVVPRRPLLYDSMGKVIPRMVTAEHLPSDPCRSQVEAFLDISRTPVLTEHAEATMRGALESCAFLVRKACSELEGAWKTRKANPSLLNQPRQNWPGGYPSSSTGFGGYRPETLPNDATLIVSQLDTERQFKSAALSDDLRHRWNTFD